MSGKYSAEHGASGTFDSSGIISGLDDVVAAIEAAATQTEADQDPATSEPIGVGGKYNATVPTYTDGDRADLQLDARGNTRAALRVSGTATDVIGLADNASTVAASATANKIGVVSRLTVLNGTDWDRVTGDAANGMDVDVTRIASQGFASSVSITRPSNTNTYGALDVIGPTGGGAASQQFSNIAGGAGEYMITRSELRIDRTTVISGETGYYLYLYSATQPGAQVDEDTFTLASGDRATFLGRLELGVPVDEGATAYVNREQRFQITTTGTSIYGVLVTITSYAAESATVHTIKLHAAKV